MSDLLHAKVMACDSHHYTPIKPVIPLLIYSGLSCACHFCAGWWISIWMKISWCNMHSIEITLLYIFIQFTHSSIILPYNGIGPWTGLQSIACRPFTHTPKNMLFLLWDNTVIDQAFVLPLLSFKDVSHICSGGWMWCVWWCMHICLFTSCSMPLQGPAAVSSAFKVPFVWASSRLLRGCTAGLLSHCCCDYALQHACGPRSGPRLSLSGADLLWSRSALSLPAAPACSSSHHEYLRFDV